MIGIKSMLDNRVAVVVGINSYDQDAITNLQGCENDANEICRQLKKNGGFEIDEKRHLLINDKATAKNIKEALSDILWEPSEKTVLFYFSGHGIVDRYSNGFIAPYDMILEKPIVNGISMTELKQLVTQSPQKTVIVIIDCCYSALLAEGGKGNTENYNGGFADHFEGVEKLDGGEGKFIFTSSDSDQQSREVETKDGTIHGIFTHKLIEGMSGKAANEKGLILLNELWKYTVEQMHESGQKPKSANSDESAMWNIILAYADDKYKEYIEDKLSYIKSNHNKTGGALINSIKLVVLLHKDFPKDTIISDWYDKLKVIYQNECDNAYDWLIDNTLKMSELGELYGILKDIVSEPNMDDISSFTEQCLANLSDLFFNAGKDENINAFIKDCRRRSLREKERKPSSAKPNYN